jgi:hypothetical protein
MVYRISKAVWFVMEMMTTNSIPISIAISTPIELFPDHHRPKLMTWVVMEMMTTIPFPSLLFSWEKRNEFSAVKSRTV